MLKKIKALIRDYMNRIFHKDKISHRYEYEKNFYNRHAFINKAISQYKDCKYLEIGVDLNQVFNSIPLKSDKKFGVDPFRGGNYRMTSNEFFQKYNHLKFNVIFIDGLHHYEQCQRDCLNSIKSLEDGGIILFHDFLPKSPFEENVPRKQSTWTGDVWKLGVQLTYSENCDFFISNFNHGIGILKVEDNFSLKNLENIKDFTFSDFENYFYYDIPLRSYNETLEKIDKYFNK